MNSGGYWWSVMTSTGREFWVLGGSYFNGTARREAEQRLDEGEMITSWQMKEQVMRA